MAFKQPPADTSSADKPLFERGRIKIYDRQGSNGKRYFDVVDGRDHKRPYEASMEAAHSGATLTPKQVWELMSGNSIEIDAVGGKGQYKAFLFLRGIGEKPKEGTKGQTFVNRYINVGRALPVIKKATGELVGFNLRHPEATAQGDNRSVCVFLNYGSRERPVTLEDPGQAYRLLKGEPVVIEGRGTLTLDGIEAKPKTDGSGGFDYTAKVKIEWGQSRSSRFTFADDAEESSAPVSRASHVAEDSGEGDYEGEPDHDDDPFAPAAAPRRSLAA